MTAKTRTNRRAYFEGGELSASTCTKPSCVLISTEFLLGRCCCTEFRHVCVSYLLGWWPFSARSTGISAETASVLVIVANEAKAAKRDCTRVSS